MRTPSDTAYRQWLSTCVILFPVLIISHAFRWHTSVRTGKDLDRHHFSPTAVSASRLSWNEILHQPGDEHNDAHGASDSDSLILQVQRNHPLSAALDASQQKKVDVADLQKKWIDICIEEMRPTDLGKFSLKYAIPLALNEAPVVELFNRTIATTNDVGSEPFQYITEQELENLWGGDTSAKMQIKPAYSFNVRDALLLIDDEDIPFIIGDEVEPHDSSSNSESTSKEDSSSSSSSISISSSITYSGSDGGESDDNAPPSVYDIVLAEATGDLAEEEEEGSVRSLQSLDDTVASLAERTIEDIPGEYLITAQELQKVWDQRATVQWGLPSNDFSVMSALLLLEPDGDDEQLEQAISDIMSVMKTQQQNQPTSTTPTSTTPTSTEYADGEEEGDNDDDDYDYDYAAIDQSNDINAGQEETQPPVVSSSQLVVTAKDTIISDSDANAGRKNPNKVLLWGGDLLSSTGEYWGIRRPEYVTAHDIYRQQKENDPLNSKKGFWDRFRGRSNQLLRETIRRMHFNLENTGHYRPAWQKERNFLSPDTDTQQFMGDIMFSNTYMTTRIPANWNDPEEDAVTNPAYRAASTMAWPGQPLTDFNLKIPIWEKLDLPFGSQAPELTLETELQLELQLEAHAAAESSPAADVGDVTIIPTAASVQSFTQQQHDGLDNGGDDDDTVDWMNFDFSSADDDAAGVLSGDADPQGRAAFTTNLDGAAANRRDPNDFYYTADIAAAADSADFEGDADTEELDESDLAIAARNRAVLFNKATQSDDSDGITLEEVYEEWTTPTEWLQHPRFADHVGYDDWAISPNLLDYIAVNRSSSSSSSTSSSSSSEPMLIGGRAQSVTSQQQHKKKGWYHFAVDDVVWDDDIYTAQTAMHINAVTDIYLSNERTVAHNCDRRMHWERAVNEVFGKTSAVQSAATADDADDDTAHDLLPAMSESGSGEESVCSVTGSDVRFREAIPPYLTPDSNRGIDYTSEVIELKGKKVLQPRRPPLKVEFENDTFHPNPDARAMNMIGTIREQYNWRPNYFENLDVDGIGGRITSDKAAAVNAARDAAGYVIEEEKLPKIQPIIDYLNHAGRLVSTKDNILIFEYVSRMRHIVGIRASMLALAKKVFPEVVDIRLETARNTDRFDR